MVRFSLYTTAEENRLRSDLCLLEARIKALRLAEDNALHLHLKELSASAKATLEKGDINCGWKLLHEAEREMVGVMNETELSILADELIREAESPNKLKSWRRKAILESLLKCRPPKDTDANEKAKGAGKPTATRRVESDESTEAEIPQQKMDISEFRARVKRALCLRDGHFDNTYYKLFLSRTQLLIASTTAGLLLAGTLIMTAAFSHFKVEPPEIGRESGSGDSSFPNGFLLLYSAFFGGLGASLTTLYSLYKRTRQNGSIPEQVAHVGLTVARPLVGAVAGLAVYAFLHTKIIWVGDLTVAHVLAGAFVGGFSERVVTGAVEKWGDSGSQGADQSAAEGSKETAS